MHALYQAKFSKYRPDTHSASHKLDPEYDYDFAVHRREVECWEEARRAASTQTDLALGDTGKHGHPDSERMRHNQLPPLPAFERSRRSVVYRHW